MAKPVATKILARYNISPPPDSTPSTSLPLTFFDIPWLFFSPTQPLFFYQYPHSTYHFLSSTLPTLIHSLSLTLHQFFPFAANLVLPLGSNKPIISYNQDNSVSLTVAESDADFFYLSDNHQRWAYQFHALLPELSSTTRGSMKQEQGIPLFAAKLTIFPNYGVCVGLAYHHVVADGRTFNNFIKTWASLHRQQYCSSSSSSSIRSSPSYDRTVIKDTHGLESIFLKEYWCIRKLSMDINGDGLVIGCNNANADLCDDMVRATFVMSPTDMAKIKQWIINQCKEKKKPEPTHLSPYNLACSLSWVCLMKTNDEEKRLELIEEEEEEDPTYLGFNAGGISRLDYPDSYFGNCIGFARCMVIRRELLGEDGIIVAASVIGNKIKEVNKAILEGAEKWISDWVVFSKSEKKKKKVHVMVVGSPKVDFYETDFGWGRPKKIEEISIDHGNGNAISLTESRDIKGGIEVGLALSKPKMDAFASAFTRSLELMKSNDDFFLT
ncbi:hypothetical protein SLA2020_334750 [Shorea laevis]